MSMDLLTATGAIVSISPGAAAAGTTVINGDWIDCSNFSGPVFADFAAGTVTGSPTTVQLTCTLQEADSSSGTGSQTIANQTSLVLTAAKGRGLIRGIRTKRFVRCVITPAFTGGTDPTAATAGSVWGWKILR